MQKNNFLKNLYCSVVHLTINKITVQLYKNMHLKVTSKTEAIIEKKILKMTNGKKGSGERDTK